MANSSEWLGAIAEPDVAQPGWLTLLGESAEFRAVWPFGAPQPDTPARAPVPPAPDPSADALARAFADGQAAGRAAAFAEAAATTARQRALRLSFHALDEAAREVLVEDLAATVIALCDNVLAGCALDRDALIARCHAAAQRIGGAATTLALQLHPDDIAALDGAALAGWRVTPDAALERGTVLIESTDGAVADGPAEWRRAIAAAVRG